MFDVKRYTDKYFTYTRQILERAGLDPWVKMQVFIRKGPGKIGGIKEATDLMIENSGIFHIGGRIYALKDGQRYKPNETVMTIEGPLQVIVEWETIYLGIISAATTITNEIGGPLYTKIQTDMASIVGLVDSRPVYYFGARHWHYSVDWNIGQAAMNGGAAGCSTDAGSDGKGLGTMPHALVVACNLLSLQATLETTTLFHKHIDKTVKRIILVDTFNRECFTAITSMNYLRGRMTNDEWEANTPGIRIDTCGENIGEGCHYNKGVTIELARKVRLALDKAGFPDVNITLSSGFANPKKVQRFVEAEKIMGIKLFDSLGVGQLFHSRSATADIVEIDGKPLSKTGRAYRPNSRLKRIL